MSTGDDFDPAPLQPSWWQRLFRRENEHRVRMEPRESETATSSMLNHPMRDDGTGQVRPAATSVSIIRPEIIVATTGDWEGRRIPPRRQPDISMVGTSSPQDFRQNFLTTDDGFVMPDWQDAQLLDARLREDAIRHSREPAKIVEHVATEARGIQLVGSIKGAKSESE